MPIGPNRRVSAVAISKGVVRGDAAVRVDANNLAHEVVRILRSFAILKAVACGHQQGAVRLEEHLAAIVHGCVL